MRIRSALCYSQLSKDRPHSGRVFLHWAYRRSLAPYTYGYVALEQVADGQLEPWTEHYGFGAMRRGVWWQSAMGTTEFGNG